MVETVVEFRSSMFKPFLPDDCQVNPGRYGAELAFWLSRRLADRGLYTSYPTFEDWGWFIEFSNERGDEYWLCCSNIERSDTEWRCFLDPKAKKLFGRSRAAVDGASVLLETLRGVLADEGDIVDINWSSEP